MKFSEKFKKNKGEAAVPETAQDSGKKKHKPDPKKLVGTISKKHIKKAPVIKGVTKLNRGHIFSGAISGFSIY